MSIAADGSASARPAATPKVHRGGCDRALSPAATLDRVRPFMGEAGITRVADVTGLDRIGIPTMAVFRPNARSLSVAQGKGVTRIEAQVSGLMESLELHHAEHVTGPLLRGSYHELRSRHPMADVGGLPRLAMNAFDPSSPMLWMAGVDLLGGETKLVPFELVHTDFRSPLPPGSGAFFMSSNGLASGNHLLEASSHGICELVERDANTLFTLSNPAWQASRRVALPTVDDPAAQEVLERFDRAALDVGIWDTTSDVGIPSFLCTIVDRDEHIPRPMPPVSGSGCHPTRRIALLRSLTEAAQGRLTIIAGARDDLSDRLFDEFSARARAAQRRASLREQRPQRSFADAPNADHQTFEEDVQWELSRLAAVGISEVAIVNLTDPRIGIPVVRVIIPYLEPMGEVRGYVPGARARRWRERTT